MGEERREVRWARFVESIRFWWDVGTAPLWASSMVVSMEGERCVSRCVSHCVSRSASMVVQLAVIVEGEDVEGLSSAVGVSGVGETDGSADGGTDVCDLDGKWCPPFLASEGFPLNSNSSFNTSSLTLFKLVTGSTAI